MEEEKYSSSSDLVSTRNATVKSYNTASDRCDTLDQNDFGVKCFEKQFSDLGAHQWEKCKKEICEGEMVGEEEEVDEVLNIPEINIMQVDGESDLTVEFITDEEFQRQENLEFCKSVLQKLQLDNYDKFEIINLSVKFDLDISGESNFSKQKYI